MTNEANKFGLPWRTNGPRLLDIEGVQFADIAGYEGIIDDENRASLIVKAVNNHDALVEMVRKLTDEMRIQDLHDEAESFLASLEI